MYMIKNVKNERKYKYVYIYIIYIITEKQINSENQFN
jgi:hypothetical protein